jgi:MFS transporter, SET family, sugar efflux transporter
MTSPASDASLRRSTTFFTKGAAFAWGLQFAFLNPALALLLTTLLHATVAQVGLALALYNASGFIASVVIPAWADRRGNYLTWMLVCGVLSLGLAAVLAFSSSLTMTIGGLVVLGGPAAVGSSLFFAYLRAAGTGRAAVMNTRAMVSVAWVAGPPIAMLLASAFGTRTVLAAIVIISLAGIGTVLGLRRAHAKTQHTQKQSGTSVVPVSRLKVIAIVAAFVLLQAANATVTSAMTLFTVDSLHLAAIWGGIALGIAALAEVPALILLGRLSNRFGQIPLLIVGIVVGIAYYLLMSVVHDPITLAAAQLLNAWSFATVSGIGITLFLEIIPKPGLASGLYTNTRRIGAIMSGGVFAIAGTGAGFSGVFLTCAALTALALLITLAVNRPSRRDVRASAESSTDSPSSAIATGSVASPSGAA